MTTKTAHLTTTKWFFIIMAALIIFLSWKIVQPFALVLVTATVAGIIFAPVDRWLQRVVKHPKLSALIIVFAVFFIIIAPLFGIGALLVQQASEIIETSFGESGWLSQLDPTDLPLFQALPEGVPVGAVLGPEGRSDLGQGAVAGHFGVGKQQILGTGLGPHRLSRGLGPFDALQASLSAEVHYVGQAAGEGAEVDGPVDGLLFYPWRAGAGEVARVHLLLGDAPVLQVVGDVAVLAV
ncbi:AI-2E family transporter [Patescibacteria group bacterium]|nr:AI-2E family transporter [Patescibacteria group bacterium]